MKYLKSVDSFVDSDNMIHTCNSENCRDTKPPIHLSKMDDEWWERLSPNDLSRLGTNGDLY